MQWPSPLPRAHHGVVLEHWRRCSISAAVSKRGGRGGRKQTGKEEEAKVVVRRKGRSGVRTEEGGKRADCSHGCREESWHARGGTLPYTHLVVVSS